TNAQVWGVFDEPGTNFYYFHNGNRQTKPLGDPRGQQLISQDSNMLRIVLEFNDVVVAIVGKHQMALCAPAHRAQMLFDLNHRRGMIPRNLNLFRARKLWRVALDEVFHAANVDIGEIHHWPALLDVLHGFLQFPSQGAQDSQSHHWSTVNSG